MDLDKVRSLLTTRKEPAFRLRQIAHAVYQDAVSSYDQITALPAALRETLAQEVPLLSLRAKEVRVSADGRAHKAILSLTDGREIESVLLKPKPGSSWSVCISVQVGCAMGCTFCATGLMGLSRNLTSEEIVDQVLFWRQYLKSKPLTGAITNVVYMGMGEPMQNLENVSQSLRVLMSPETFGMSARHIAVSTVGLAPAMERFLAEFPQVNLALSLHAAQDVLRDKLVPVNRAHPLKRLAEVLKNALDKNRRKIFLEYVLLSGENDRPEDALNLARYIRSIGRPDLLHINLIAWNPTDTPHAPSSVLAARVFRDLLRQHGLHVTIRKNLGADIQGACGQLITSTRSPA